MTEKPPATMCVVSSAQSVPFRDYPGLRGYAAAPAAPIPANPVKVEVCAAQLDATLCAFVEELRQARALDGARLDAFLRHTDELQQMCAEALVTLGRPAPVPVVNVAAPVLPAPEVTVNSPPVPEIHFRHETIIGAAVGRKSAIAFTMLWALYIVSVAVQIYFLISHAKFLGGT